MALRVTDGFLDYTRFLILSVMIIVHTCCCCCCYCCFDIFTVVEGKRSPGIQAVWVARNRFAVLDKNRQVGVREGGGLLSTHLQTCMRGFVLNLRTLTLYSYLVLMLAHAWVGVCTCIVYCGVYPAQVCCSI